MMKFTALVTTRRMLRGGLAVVTGAILSACVTMAASAQPYPSKPITLVVGLAPGSGQDTSARTVSRRAGEILGVQIVVENKPGAGTMTLGFVPRTMTPEEFAAFLHDEMARWPAIVAAAGISAE